MLRLPASLTVLALCLGLVAPAATAENRIDTQRPDAPELAAYGDFEVGVRTLALTNPDQIDVLAVDPAAPEPETLRRYDRPLTVEVWYPAEDGASGATELKAFMRDGRTEITLVGRAMRDALPARAAAPFPLVIVSHGYPGNRFLLAHLAENLASKGYVVASIDHTDSTYRTQAAFGSTLVNRSLDQIFVLNATARLSAAADGFLSGLADPSNAALIGYSMGGYGAVITAGGGVTRAAVGDERAPPFGLLAVHETGSDSHDALVDPRIKAAVAFAPWGFNHGFWDAETLKGIRIPMLFVAGSQDDVSGYANGTRAIWENAVNVDRAFLTFADANHNAGAPFPAPAESYGFDAELGFAPFEHYADAVWDTVRMNNIAQHFVTAWLGKHLKGDAAMDAYLDLVPDSNQGVWAVDDAGTPTPEHTAWKGFQDRTAKGLLFETKAAGE